MVSGCSLAYDSILINCNSEPAFTFMEDSHFSGDTLPLILTHYYWSEFGKQYGGTLSGCVSFTVALYNTHTNA